MFYWLIDGESEMVGKGAAPVEIATDTDYKIFKALYRTDKSFNVFVKFREIVGEKNDIFKVRTRYLVANECITRNG